MLVGAIGLEPTTPTMSRWCSNQLSYAPSLPHEPPVASKKAALYVPLYSSQHSPSVCVEETRTFFDAGGMAD